MGIKCGALHIHTVLALSLSLSLCFSLSYVVNFYKSFSDHLPEDHGRDSLVTSKTIGTNYILLHGVGKINRRTLQVIILMLFIALWSLMMHFHSGKVGLFSN